MDLLSNVLCTRIVEDGEVLTNEGQLRTIDVILLVLEGELELGQIAKKLHNVLLKNMELVLLNFDGRSTDRVQLLKRRWWWWWLREEEGLFGKGVVRRWFPRGFLLLVIWRSRGKAYGGVGKELLGEGVWSFPEEWGSPWRRRSQPALYTTG